MQGNGYFGIIGIPPVFTSAPTHSCDPYVARMLQESGAVYPSPFSPGGESASAGKSVRGFSAASGSAHRCGCRNMWVLYGNMPKNQMGS